MTDEQPIGYDVVPMQYLHPLDPQPEMLGIVVDAFGVAHQRRNLSDGDKWYESGYNRPVSWESLQALGPLLLVGMSFGTGTGWLVE